MNWTRLERLLFPTLRQSLHTWSPRARLLLRIALGLISVSAAVFLIGMSLVAIGNRSGSRSLTIVGLLFCFATCLLLMGGCILPIIAYAILEP